MNSSLRKEVRSLKFIFQLRPNFVLALTFFLTLTSGAAVTRAQILEQVVNGKSQKKEEAKRKNNQPARQTTNSTPRQPTIRKTKSNKAPAVPKVDERQPVTFLIGASGVEVLVDGKLLSASDQNGKLKAWVAPGERLVTARKFDKELFPPTTIQVSAEKDTFDFSADIAKKLEEIKQEQLAEDARRASEAKRVDVKTVLEKYRDPNESDRITPEDWTSVYEQTRASMMIGNTENDVEALFSFAQGQIELAVGNKPKAVNLFSAATVFLPNSAMMHYALGKANLESNNLPAAATAFNRAIQLDPKYVLAYKGLGDIALAQNKTKEAATYFQQAQNLGMTTAELRLKIAETQIKNKNCAAAIKELDVLARESPNTNVLMALSDCHLVQDRAVSAIEALKKAIELDQNSALAHFKIGKIYLEQKEFGNAKESLERALALDTAERLNRKELQNLIKRAQKRAQ